MKCPWQTVTTIIPAIYHPVETARNEQHITEFADCIKEECPFWGAIGMMYNVDNGLYQETETGCRRAKKGWNPQ